MNDKGKIIIGLGNPGKNYAQTYHNVGQQCLSFLASSEKFSHTHPLFSSFQLNNNSEKIFLFIRPNTFMNDSGLAVVAALSYFRLKPENLLVIHDEFDIPLGEFKISQNRGSAGHHGIDSIIRHLKTKKFSRIRIGIMFPEKKASDIVLKTISAKHKKILQRVFEKVQEKLIVNT